MKKLGVRILAGGIMLSAAAMVVPSCLGATAVSVEVRTNVPFRDNLNVTITVGTPGETENAEPTTQTTTAWGADGFIGSLTVVPSDENDRPLAVKAVLGVRRGARECLPPAYAGCIVARRRLRYLPNEVLRLPIILYAQCEGVPCDESSTCNAFGTCVPADVDPEKCGTPEGCVVPGDPPPSGLIPDASGIETSTNDSGGIDSGAADSTTGEDGSSSSDAQASNDADGSDLPTELEGGIIGPEAGGNDDSGGGSVGDAGGAGPGFVDCRDVTCQIGVSKCCYSTVTHTGFCTAPANPCPNPTGMRTLECDDKGDCNLPQKFCCYSEPAGSFCSPIPCAEQTMCILTGQCGTSCGPTRIDDYYRICTP